MRFPSLVLEQIDGVAQVEDRRFPPRPSFSQPDDGDPIGTVARILPPSGPPVHLTADQVVVLHAWLGELRKTRTLRRYE